METSKSITPNDEPVPVFNLGQPFDIEQALDIDPERAYSADKASDGCIEDLAPIPPLKELRMVWRKSMSRFLPPRR